LKHGFTPLVTPYYSKKRTRQKKFSSKAAKLIVDCF